MKVNMLNKLVVIATFGVALLNPFFAFAKNSNDLIASAEHIKQVQISPQMRQEMKMASLDLQSDTQIHLKEAKAKENSNDLRKSALSEASLAMFGLFCFVARAGRRRV